VRFVSLPSFGQGFDDFLPGQYVLRYAREDAKKREEREDDN
jgi:hypothetical protein